PAPILARRLPGEAAADAFPGKLRTASAPGRAFSVPFLGGSLPMARFAGVDFYASDSLLTEEERQIRDHVRGWVEERYLPLIEKAYEDAIFPLEVIPEVAGMGLLGATLPEKYGCAGINPTAYGLAMQ